MTAISNSCNNEYHAHCTQDEVVCLGTCNTHYVLWYCTTAGTGSSGNPSVLVPPGSGICGPDPCIPTCTGTPGIRTRYETNPCPVAQEGTDGGVETTMSSKP
jgi:hypothetical protein